MSAPQKSVKKTGRDGVIIIEDASLKLRPVRKKMRVGRGKSADTALFKSENIKVYVNARACKNPPKKKLQNGEDTLEGESLNPCPALH